MTEPDELGKLESESDEPETKPIDILLVEPNPGDARLFSESLTDGSFTNHVYTVSDGGAALDFVHRRGEFADAPLPDLVLLDPRLPGGTGDDVLSELNGDPKLDDVPIVLLASSEAEEKLLKSRSGDADAFIQKPVEPEDFVAFVQSIEDFWFTIVRRSTAD